MLRLGHEEGRLKHAFSKEYIRMAAAAPELQAVMMARKIFNVGDYVIFESAYTPAGTVSMIDDRSGGIPQDNAQVWLPQLHQLMQLFGDFNASLDAIRSGLGFPGAGAPPGYYERFHSWEECTLAVLMLKKSSKIWDGKDWVASQP